jgi:hypothetical protein
MWTMGKKNRKRFNKHVSTSLKSFQELGKRPGFGAADTMSRLATTVKADAETLVLSAQKAALKGEKKARGKFADVLQSVGRITQKIVPSRFKGGYSPAVMETNKKLQKLARQMAQGNQTVMPREPRSRLPYFIAFIVMLLVGGGYYTYQHVSIPKIDLDFKVGKYLDPNKWLDLASGKVKPKHKKTVSSTSRGGSTAGLVKAYRVPKSVVHIPKKAPTRADKAFAKLPKQTKKQIWKKRLAKLKKAKARSDFKKASYKKTSHKKKYSSKKAFKKTTTKGSSKAKRATRSTGSKSKRGRHAS